MPVQDFSATSTTSDREITVEPAIYYGNGAYIEISGGDVSADIALTKEQTAALAAALVAGAPKGLAWLLSNPSDNYGWRKPVAVNVNGYGTDDAVEQAVKAFGLTEGQHRIAIMAEEGELCVEDVTLVSRPRIANKRVSAAL